MVACWQVSQLTGLHAYSWLPYCQFKAFLVAIAIIEFVYDLPLYTCMGACHCNVHILPYTLLPYTLLPYTLLPYTLLPYTLLPYTLLTYWVCVCWGVILGSLIISNSVITISNSVIQLGTNKQLLRMTAGPNVCVYTWWISSVKQASWEMFSCAAQLHIIL